MAEIEVVSGPEDEIELEDEPEETVEPLDLDLKYLSLERPIGVFSNWGVSAPSGPASVSVTPTNGPSGTALMAE
mgnify:CR=1 FL=1